MNFTERALTFGLILFLPVAFLTFYFSAYICTDTQTLIKNCAIYQIAFSVIAPFILGFVVQKLNVLFTHKMRPEALQKTTRIAHRILALPIAIFVFLIAQPLISILLPIKGEGAGYSYDLLISITSGIIAVGVFIHLVKK